MLQFLTPVSPPVRDYWYVCADGTKLRSPDLRTLYSMCKSRGEERNFETWSADCIHKICLTLPVSACSGSDNGDQRVETLTLGKIRDFVMAAVSVARSAVKGEAVYVTQQEADRRAGVCKVCRYNVPTTCTGCSGLLYLGHAFLQGREVQGQGDIGSCQVCGCHLPVLVWCSPEVLGRIDANHEFPGHCWRSE